MSHDENQDASGGQPETALEEVLREIEDAENRAEESARQRRHRGEAGDAVTPNERAQEEPEGE
ncbi:hypothetical protein [Streptomyces sp. NPDC002611]